VVVFGGVVDVCGEYGGGVVGFDVLVDELLEGLVVE